MNPCPSSGQLYALLAQELQGAEAEAVEAHVEECAACQEAAYAHFPGLGRPWLALAWQMPPGFRTTLFFATLMAASGMGLVTAVLVRPKNRSADIVAGAITGLISGVIAFTLSYGWLMAAFTAVLPTDADLKVLSEAAATGRPESVLDRYPELRDIPPGERGPLLYHKVRADLLTGIPVGIWLGMLYIVGIFGAGCICVTMAAGSLLRRHGRLRSVLLPYLEIALPVSILISMAFGSLFGSFFNRFTLRFWHLAMFVFLVLTIVSILRGWPWRIRLALQVGWIVSGVLLGVAKVNAP
jgi:hypothetical protein